MQSKFLIFIMSLLSAISMEAQNINPNFTLEVSTPSLTGKLYFGYFERGLTYVLDSANIENNKAVFDIDYDIETGEYFLHSNAGFFLNLLVDKNDRNVIISIDEQDKLKSIVRGSKDSNLLLNYLSLNKKATALNKSLSETENEADAKRLSILNDSISQLIVNNADSWFGKYAKGRTYITLPYTIPTSAEEFYVNKNYGYNHYFDNIDMTDPAFWKTSYYPNYIENYLKEWVSPFPDSLALVSSKLVEKTSANDYCFKEMLSFLFNKALESEKMGDENIWARLYEDYMQGKNISWIDQKDINEIEKRYELIKTNRIGMQAQPLDLKTIEGTDINTGEIDAKILVLYFYNHTCGHCEKDLPELHKLYEEYKDKGVEVVTVDINTNKDKAIEFIKRLNLGDWINCMDTDYKSKFWLYYNISGVPSVYVLDKNKTIIAKDIDTKVIKHIFESLNKEWH